MNALGEELQTIVSDIKDAGNYESIVCRIRSKQTIRTQ